MKDFFTSFASIIVDGVKGIYDDLVNVLNEFVDFVYSIDDFIEK